MPEFLVMRKKPLAWRRYALWVGTARNVVRRQALGLELMPGERARLAELPADVRCAINRCKRGARRYRSSHLDHQQKKPRVVNMDQPRHVWGFHDVMTTIAAYAGRSTKSLYRWEQEFRASLDQPRQMPWRPKGTHARRKRGDAFH
jgi:hypothetical protein